MSVHSKYTSALNYRTLISIIISFIATWLSYKYDFRFNLDLTLISVAVVFPLVFTLGSAFQRRDKSLEHLSRTKAALATIYYSFTQARDMPEKTKDEIYEGIKKIKVSLITFLSSQSNDRTDLNKNIGNIKAMVEEHKESLGRGCSASCNFFCSMRMLARRKWKLKRLGLSSIALRVDNSASFNFPCSFKSAPRFK